MPIYEFHCQSCDQQFETLVLSASDPIRGPGCDGEQVRKLMSTFAFKSGDRFTSASSGADCSGCTSKNCSSCG